MVLVQSDQGVDIGFVVGERTINQLPDTNNDGTAYTPKIILPQHLIDTDETLNDLLQKKIVAENYALAQCKIQMNGHRLGENAEAFVTEIQFDRKKLTVYMKKYHNVSVCRLVRRLFERFKMRIKVLEVESVDILHERVWRYLHLSKLNIPFHEFFRPTLEENSCSFLLDKIPQFNCSPESESFLSYQISPLQHLHSPTSVVDTNIHFWKHESPSQTQMIPIQFVPQQNSNNGMERILGPPQRVSLPFGQSAKNLGHRGRSSSIYSDKETCHSWPNRNMPPDLDTLSSRRASGIPIQRHVQKSCPPRANSPNLHVFLNNSAPEFLPRFRSTHIPLDYHHRHSQYTTQSSDMSRSRLYHHPTPSLDRHSCQTYISSSTSPSWLPVEYDQDPRTLSSHYNSDYQFISTFMSTHFNM